MAYQVSASDLILNARRRSNLQGALAFLPDAEVLDYVNASIAHWYDLVRLTTWGGQFYRKTAVIQLVQNQTFYGIPDGFPSDCSSVLSVDGFITPGAGPIVISVMPYQEEDRNAFRWPMAAGIYAPCYYQLQGDGIAFLPVPFAGFQVGINYVPTAPVLVTTDDLLETWNGWQEWIVLDVAIKMLMKDGDAGDLTPLLASERERQERRIIEAAAGRNVGMPETAHDVEQYGGRGMGRFGGW